MIPGGDAVTDPAGHAAAVVMSADPSLAAAMVRAAVEKAGGGRARRRRLAAALDADPSVLATGKSPAPAVVSDLLLALRAGGAAGFSLPCCASCGRETTVPQHHGGHWYCRTCARRLSAHEPCASCGRRQPVATRDRAGQPRCIRCPDPDDRDPVAVLAGVVARLDPALPPGAVASAARSVFGREGNLRRLAWMVEADPALLAGDGARAPAGSVLRLIDELAAEGATGIIRPACPHCGRVMRLHRRVQGQWSCRRCAARAAAVPCSRCGRVSEPASREPGGQPICAYCLVSDPVNLEDCVRCGRRRQVGTRTAEGPVCGSCSPRQVMTCTVCGRPAPCMISKVTGQPWCTACAASWATCSQCGNLAPVKAGTRDQPLCAGCAAPGASLWRACPGCGTPGRILAGACRRCHLRDEVGHLLADPATGRTRAGLEPLRQAIADAGRPATALGWIRRDKVRALLAGLATGDRPLTHAALDELPDSKTLRHLRSVLVSSGALPARDEILIRLERWIRQAVGGRPDAGQKQLLHSYATWHVLRRLRQRARDTPVTEHQAATAKETITAAIAFLDWLDARGLAPATCAQGDLDAWMAGASTAQKGRTGNFVRWARSRKHTSLDFPATRWNGPTRTLGTEERWNQARRLLHDEALDPGDRFAGLLVLLYAQQPAAISRLALDKIDASDSRVLLRLGREPILLPGPLDGLARHLIATRRGHAAIGDHGASPWLFPGGRPGQPISPYSLAGRLHKIGIQPGPARSTALFQLATELPAAVLARMLGIHIGVAVQWQKISSGDWAAYAADVSRRTTPESVPSRHETPART
jgi:hypothetical protein